MQTSRLALDRDMECRPVVGCVLRELLSESADGRAEIMALNCGIPKSLHGIPAFSDCIGYLLDRAVQHVQRDSRTVCEQLGNGVKPQQNTVEALKESVVEISGNPCALAHARVQCHLELMVQVPDTQLVGEPQHRQQHRRAQTAEMPRGMYHGGRMRICSATPLSFQSPRVARAWTRNV